MKNRAGVLSLVISAALFLAFLTTELPTSASADDRKSFELGFQNAVRSSDRVATRILGYGEGHFDRDFEAGDASWNFESGLRLQDDFENGDQPNGEVEASIRSLSMTYAQGPARIKIGFQEIPWGESFGFQIADIVNPRDWRDPLFLDSSWVRLPVFALQNQFFFGGLTLQSIFTPVARNNRLPEDGSPFDPSRITPTGQAPRLGELPRRPIEDFPHDAEFGGKIGYLFESGLDLSVFGLRHVSRTPMYKLTTAPELSLVPIAEYVTTVGTSFSLAKDAWVYRADSLVHFGQPLPVGLGAVEVDRTQWQTVAGVDWTSPGGGWVVGAQYHNEIDAYVAETFKLNWVSAKALAHLPGDKLDVEMFLFSGIDNLDLWIQPKFTWRVNAHWNASLRYDYIRGGRSPEAGYLTPFADQSRAMLWVSLKL